MSEVTNLDVVARPRSGKGAARETRRQGLVPGVIYGSKQAPVTISVDPRRLWAEMNKAGFRTRLFSVQVDGKNELCLVRDVQRQPVNDQPVHVDFLRVDPESKIHVRVPVHFANQDKSPGLKRGGVLNVVEHEIELFVAAGNIPKQVVIDVSNLDIGDSVHLTNADLPAGATLEKHEQGATVATIAAPSVTPAGGEGEAAPAAAATPAAEAATPAA
jgi:large subunit ribosomal protein L25